MRLGRSTQDRLLAVLALLELGRVLKRPTGREGLLGRIVELVHDGAGGGGYGICGGCVGAFFLVVCAPSALFLGESIGRCIPSITLPSRQLPGLLCFGAGFFSLILGATLIVSSSLAAADKEVRRCPSWSKLGSINTFDVPRWHGFLRIDGKVVAR